MVHLVSPQEVLVTLHALDEGAQCAIQPGCPLIGDAGLKDDQASHKTKVLVIGLIIDETVSKHMFSKRLLGTYGSGTTPTNYGTQP